MHKNKTQQRGRADQLVKATIQKAAGIRMHTLSGRAVGQAQYLTRLVGLYLPHDRKKSGDNIYTYIYSCTYLQATS